MAWRGVLALVPHRAPRFIRQRAAQNGQHVRFICLASSTSTLSYLRGERYVLGLLLDVVIPAWGGPLEVRWDV